MQNIINLLHDTYLKKVQLTSTDILLFFSFYLTDENEYTVKLISKNVSNVSCTELLKNNQEQTIDLYNLKGADCIRAEQNIDTIEMILENIQKDTIIKLKYKSEINTVNGNIEQLKQFWDISTNE